MMALSDNKRLYDIATRLAVYAEDVKVWQARQFAAVLREVNFELARLLGRVRYKSLDGLSKSQLNKLVIELRESQSKIYTAYTQTLIEQLKEFMRADLEVNRTVWATARLEMDSDEAKEVLTEDEAISFLKDESPQDANAIYGVAAISGADEKLWSQISNTPISANGLYLLPFIKTFTNSAQTGVENIIRKAWANKWTVEETLRELSGDGETSQGTPSQLHRINVQAGAVIHTAMSHVGAIVTAGVLSAVFGRYMWVSVIDGKTSDICLSRSRRVYRFGNGPLPPAHIRCRSHITPVLAAEDPQDETLYTWVARQPAVIQDDALGTVAADKLRKGLIKAKDIAKYESISQLNYSQFRKKIIRILTR